jgi:hypothetical protein
MVGQRHLVWLQIEVMHFRALDALRHNSMVRQINNNTYLVRRVRLVLLGHPVRQGHLVHQGRLDLLVRLVRQECVMAVHSLALLHIPAMLQQRAVVCKNMAPKFVNKNVMVYLPDAQLFLCVLCVTNEFRFQFNLKHVGHVLSQ